jgi:hypothetical protein
VNKSVELANFVGEKFLENEKIDCENCWESANKLLKLVNFVCKNVGEDEKLSGCVNRDDENCWKSVNKLFEIS